MRLPDDIVLKAMSLKDQYFDLQGLSAYPSLGVSTLRDLIGVNGLPFTQEINRLIWSKGMNPLEQAKRELGWGK